jgi:predicted O-linked N-acetylglucosamine transferase (SPINDLY family)
MANAPDAGIIGARPLWSVICRDMNQIALQSKVNNLVVQEDYAKSVQDYEEAIQSCPHETENYWCLGLAYLLQGQEDAAALVWFSAVSEQEDEDASIQSLVQVLDMAAECLKIHGQISQAWTVRYHICEFSPQNLPNLLELCNLAFELEELTGDVLTEIGIIDTLQSTNTRPDSNLIEATLAKVLQVPDAETLEFAEACLGYIKPREQWSLIVTSAAATMAFQRKLVNFAIALIELCLKHDPDNITALIYLPRFLAESQQYTKAIEAAQSFYRNCTTLENRFLSSCVLLQTLMRTGDWREVPAIANQFKTLVSELLQNQSTQLPLHTIQFLIVNTGLFAYLQDNLAENRKLQNQAAQLFLKNIRAIAPKTIQPAALSSKQPTQRLKIGYIASTFRRHSVGWLSRWLFKYHNHEKFELSAYLVQQDPNDQFFQSWFLNQFDQIKMLSNDAGVAAECIRDDQLDILVDLDSLTLDFTCTVLALKPAPIQVTWLGCDASGLPTIDYFIADPYVLSDNAQEHYQEKIWRLPQTYIAVDGFEIGVPTLQRSDLNIPEDAIVYWSSQVGFKRNPDIVRLQMRILNRVPKSYFLIKGLGDQDIIRNSFIKIAEEESVLGDRLKFLPMMIDEYTHRANLQIADIALDTYPYNGATTSLEILWAGIPLVTRVGNTFSSRNSYAFLQNLGVNEGIAWTDEEYVEWGVCLAENESIRQKISCQLRSSRHTSSLWDAKKFTCEMENAYQEMWDDYLSKA